MRKIKLTISGVFVEIHTSNSELVERLNGDFSEFLDSMSTDAADLTVFTHLKDIPEELLQAASKGTLTKNARVRDVSGIRYSDYGGEALCRLDFKSGRADVYSPLVHRLQEVVYLLVLSRVGKILDLRGLHRLHAMGVEFDGYSVLCTMPMGGGKTTLFLSLLQAFSKAKIISDDSPLINRAGEVSPFPLRVGVKGNGNPQEGELKNLNWQKAYSLDRMQYGLKWLFPVSAFQNPVAKRPSAKIILMTGKKDSQSSVKIQRSSFFRLYKEVFVSLVIGVGLPIMREHFLEMTWRDGVKLAQIFFSRLWTSWVLTWKSEKYFITLSTDLSQNAKAVADLAASLKRSRGIPLMLPEENLPRTST